MIRLHESRIFTGFWIGATTPKTECTENMCVDINNSDDKWLMSQVCKYWQIHGRTSPLCDNWDLFNNLKQISNNKWVSFNLMVGITYAESHIGVNFNPQRCNITNNRSGKKWQIYDDGSKSPRFNHMDNRHEWCWLYTFDTVEHFWNSYANGLYYWYVSKSCTTPECISRRWVKWDWEISQSRVNRVKLFYNL